MAGSCNTTKMTLSIQSANRTQFSLPSEPVYFLCRNSTNSVLPATSWKYYRVLYFSFCFEAVMYVVVNVCPWSRCFIQGDVPWDLRHDDVKDLWNSVQGMMTQTAFDQDNLHSPLLQNLGGDLQSSISKKNLDSWTSKLHTISTKANQDQSASRSRHCDAGILAENPFHIQM